MKISGPRLDHLPRLLAALLAGLLVGLAPTGPARAEEEATPFTGRIVFEQTAAGESEGAKAFRGLVAPRVVVHIGSQTYRQDEEGGLNEGSYIARVGGGGCLRLDHREKRSERGGAMDLDATEPTVRALMPGQFKTALEPTEQTDTICGHAVKRYKVTASGFVKKGATAHVWIAEGLRTPRRRFQFEFEFKRVVSPIPLSIPLERGTILKVEILEAGVPVTIVATEVAAGTPPASLFEKPTDYEGPAFPKPRPAEPVGPAGGAPARAMPASELAALPRRLTDKAGIQLVLILPGTFSMGSPPDERGRRDDETPHDVTITRPFYVAAHEVTQKQWAAVMGTESPSHFKGESLPVESVSWDQAVAFCAQLSKLAGATYRLPTEAEWEYGARAGESVPYTPHPAFKQWLNERAWQPFNAKYRTHPVGTLTPNAWGLYDTIGNVGEWTGDGYGPYGAEPARDPRGVKSSRKVIRGGDWVTSYDLCRVACRSSREAGKGKSTVGLRVVRVP